MFEGKARCLPKWGTFKVIRFDCNISVSTSNIRLGLKCLLSADTSLSQQSVNYTQKGFITFVDENIELFSTFNIDEQNLRTNKLIKKLKDPNQNGSKS